MLMTICAKEKKKKILQAKPQIFCSFMHDSNLCNFNGNLSEYDLDGKIGLIWAFS